jgi:FkbM family methyltransferase
VRASEVRAEVAAALAVLRPAHLVHVGAHEGEEVLGYRAAGIDGRITLVEPIPALAARLRARFVDVEVVEAACSDTDGTAVLRVPRRTNMASIVDGLDGKAIEVVVRRLDGIAPDADAAVIDVQGHELAVLAAAPWPSLRAVVVETCTVDDPRMAAPHADVEAVMAGQGFRQVAAFPRDYQAVARWATGVTPAEAGEVRDVVYVRT